MYYKESGFCLQPWSALDPTENKAAYLRSGTPLEESRMRWQGMGETQGNSWLGAEGKKTTR